MTRILIISDIHANLNALETVLTTAGKVDAVWCLGDLVGYGPDPNACIELLKEQPNLACVCGNHDAAVLGRINLSVFNYEARESLSWTKKVLTENNLDYLRSLPDSIHQGDCLLVHGSPMNPLREYILDGFIATLNFKAFEEKCCMAGHSHIPNVFFMDDDRKMVDYLAVYDGDTFDLKEKNILNPGSVGQPRDHDPRASFVLFYPEIGRWENKRLEYDIRAVQQKIRQAMLPEKHAHRLDYGV